MLVIWAPTRCSLMLHQWGKRDRWMLSGVYHCLNYLQHGGIIVEFTVISSGKQIAVPAHISEWFLRFVLNTTATTTTSPHNQRMFNISFHPKFKDTSSLLTIIAGDLESLIFNSTLQNCTANMPISATATTTTIEPRPFSVGGVVGGITAAIIIIIIFIILFIRHKRRRMLRRGMYSNQVQGIQLQRWYGH